MIAAWMQYEHEPTLWFDTRFRWPSVVHIFQQERNLFKHFESLPKPTMLVKAQ